MAKGTYKWVSLILNKFLSCNFTYQRMNETLTFFFGIIFSSKKNCTTQYDILPTATDLAVFVRKKTNSKLSVHPCTPTHAHTCMHTHTREIREDHFTNYSGALVACQGMLRILWHSNCLFESLWAPPPSMNFSFSIINYSNLWAYIPKSLMDVWNLPDSTSPICITFSHIHTHIHEMV